MDDPYLKNLTVKKQKLLQEVAELEKAEREERNKQHAVKAAVLADALTPEFIDAVVPFHQTHACNDGYLRGGFVSFERSPNCLRCALMEIRKVRYFPPNFDLQIRFSCERPER